MKLRLLHLSDLHFGYGQTVGNDCPVEAFNQDVVTRSMLNRIEALVKSKEKPDFILITGDLAKSGKREEYMVARVFCEHLLNATGIPNGKLYIVPGNHDVNRTKISNVDIENIYRFGDQDSISRTLSNSDVVTTLLNKFSEFNEFARFIMQHRWYDESEYYIVDNVKMNGGSETVWISIVGLNSALFAGYDGDDRQKLALGLHQVEGALDQISKQAILSIGFLHHPFSCFHSIDKVCQNRLKDKLNIILTGHSHEPTSVAIVDQVGRVVIIGAGASYETRESHNSFDLIEIDLATGEAWVEFYRYIPERQCWSKDFAVYPYREDGRFPFTIEDIWANPFSSQFRDLREVVIALYRFWQEGQITRTDIDQILKSLLKKNVRSMPTAELATRELSKKSFHDIRRVLRLDESEEKLYHKQLNNAEAARQYQIIFALRYRLEIVREINGIRFILIPPGTSPDGCLNLSSYYISETPISFSEWYHIMDAKIPDSISQNDPSAKVDISIADIRDFIKKVKHEYNEEVDIPTIHQYEFARFHSSMHRNNYRRQMPILRKGEPSPFGIHDLLGTVWQFCRSPQTDQLKLYGGSFRKEEWHRDLMINVTNDFYSSDEIGCRLILVNPQRGLGRNSI